MCGFLKRSFALFCFALGLSAGLSAQAQAQTYSIGGTASGLASGQQITLRNRAGGAMVTVSANGSYIFPTALASSAKYLITIQTMLISQSCTVSNPIGTVGSANVTNINLSCVSSGGENYSVGGTVSGLGSGKSVVLKNNSSGETTTVSANGAFTVSPALANGSSYAVMVLTNPAGQNCSVSNGSGTISGANVSNVSVSCVNTSVTTYTVGGSLSGLGTGKTVSLQNNGTNTLNLATNGTFSFSTALANGASYAVAVSTLPTGQTCTVSNGSGVISGANVTNANVVCVTSSGTSYSLGGNVTGLGSGKSVVLKNNSNGNTATVSSNSSFTFSTLLATGSNYEVSVQSQPTGQTCAVSNGSGTIGSANVTNVGVSCSNNSTGGVWQNFTLDTFNGKARLTLNANEALLANAPFYGIEVRKNGVDITDDIINIETLTNTSWRYTFGTENLSAAGATISISLKNTALASPGHYVAVRGYGTADDVQGTYQVLLDCQNGVGECAGKGAKPGLLAAIKGLSARYEPRDIETRAAGATVSTYNFNPIFKDAAFLATKGKKLNVIFKFKTFLKAKLYKGDGSNRTFDIPPSNDGPWDGERDREVHAYVKNASGVWNEATFQFNAARSKVILNAAPPTPADNKDNITVVYARDPFPEYTWHMNPPVGGWYHGGGGQSTEAAAGAGSFGFVYAPWRTSTVIWLKSFMGAFQKKWNEAIDAGTLPADAIESVTIQETANALNKTDSTYTAEGHRKGLFELGKFTARAVRRKALFGQMFNVIDGGNQTNQMAKLADEIIPWGGRLEGPDLFNDEPDLETNVYTNIHRAFNDRTMTMIWQQNASFSERKNKTINNYTAANLYSPAQQFIKAQRGVNDFSTPGGKAGLRAEYVFWNMTKDAPFSSPLNFIDHALPVILDNPTIQTSGNDLYLWRRAANGTAIADQTLTK